MPYLTYLPRDRHAGWLKGLGSIKASNIRRFLLWWAEPYGACRTRLAKWSHVSINSVRGAVKPLPNMKDYSEG